MKKLLIIAGCMVAASAVLAQGTLNFANGAAGVNAPIKNSAGTLITAGNNYVADLFWVTTTAGVIAPESSLAAAGINGAFAASPAGYFLDGAQTLPGTASGGVITAEVRVWNTVIGAATGQSYAAANSTAGGEWGKSIEFNVTLGGGPLPAGNLTGLNGNGFTLTLNPTQTPEPSTFALAGLGAAALMIFRRRK